MSGTEMSATEVTNEAGGIDLAALARGGQLPGMAESLSESRRQLEICNACRYCESYCAVFPAMSLRRTFNARCSVVTGITAFGRSPPARKLGLSL